MSKTISHDIDNDGELKYLKHNHQQYMNHELLNCEIRLFPKVKAAALLEHFLLEHVQFGTTC